MNGYRREQTEPRGVQLNQGLTESALDDVIYRPRFSGVALSPSGGTAAGFTAGTATSYMVFPKAGTPVGRISYAIPSAFWIGGTLTGRFVWSGSVASAVTNVRWQLQLAPTALGAVPAVVTTAVAVVAGPTAILAVQDTTFAATFPVNSSHIHLGISISRGATDATDTYAGDAWLYSFQIIYTPVAGH